MSTTWLTAASAQDVAPVCTTIVRPPLATVVLDRDGGLIGEIGPEARSWVRIVDLPAYVGQAFVATEDRRFYQHDGVDVVGVMGAIRDNILHGFGSRGASTITQQLVGAMGCVDRRDISLARKAREAELARTLERHHTKAEILEAYINFINFGHGWYGVESAARHYFGKRAAELSLPEAAMLAALPKTPVGYDPRSRPDQALQRRNTVLALMQDQGYISAAQRRAAAAVRLRTAPNEGYSVRAPYVLESVRQWMIERYGLAAVNNAGMTALTTLDPVLQAAAESALVRGLARVESVPGYRWPRYARSTGAPDTARTRRTRYLQGLMVSLDPANGDVLAMVGGRDFRDSEFNRAVQGVRQAGSAFKPIVYSTALSQGLPPTTILNDEPISLPRGDGTRWMPENSDGTFSGPVTMRTALVRSLNVPAVRLGLMVGMDSIVGEARRLGLSTPVPPFASTTIGAADVHPIELIGAYSAFATLGGWVPPRLVTLVQDASGIPVYEAQAPVSQPVLNPQVAFQLTSMLKDAVRIGTGTAARRDLPDSLPMAGKTGTTNDNADVWFVGYTPNLVTGVWLGFDQRQTITRGAFGGTLAAPIWNAYTRSAYRHRAVPADWTMPEGLVSVRVRRRDGALALNDTTDAAVTEYFLAGTEPTVGGIAQRIMRRLPLLTPLR